MRVTQNMYYKNIYGQNNSQLNSKLFDVNKQIASGVKIQYASEDVLTFNNTMRLDNELTTLGQIKESTESGYKVSNQTDSVLNDFTGSMDRVKTLMIQAASDTQSEASRHAIALELRGLETHFKNLANTSINGQYLFSGSATDIKPIADDGTYMGNDHSRQSFLGSGVEQNFNLSGADLFLGEEPSIKKQITTNIPQYNLSERYPDFADSASDVNGHEVIIKTEDTIRDFMGSISDAANGESHFYIRGTKSSGEAFNKQISMSDSETVGELLTQIGNAFGNTSDLKLVNVSLDPYGEIMIEDKMTGSSKLDFHMVGAVDFDQIDGVDEANINDSIYGATAGNIDHLAAGETNFDEIIKGTSSADNDKLYVKKFLQSSYEATPRTQDLIKATYTQNPATVGDTYDITIDYGNGNAPVTHSGTFAALELALEGTLNFTVDQDDANGEFVVHTTLQGIENGVSISTGLVKTSGPVASIVADVINSAVPTGSEALLYDRTMFSKDGSTLTSTTPQVLKSTNAFAKDSTKISEVADISRGTTDTTDDGLAGTQFKLEGTTTSGSQYTALINFKDTAGGGSEFILDTTGNGIPDITNATHTIYDTTSTPRAGVNADDMTYRQIMDVINMVTTGNVPSLSNTGLLTVDTATVPAGAETLTFNFDDGVTVPATAISIVAPGTSQADNIQAYLNGINAQAPVGITATLRGTDLIISNSTGTNYTITNPVSTGGFTGIIGGEILDAATSTDIDYDAAIQASNISARTFIDYDGTVAFEDLNNSKTKANISIFDSNSGDFTTGINSSVMTFNSNNALAISDSKTDFFKSLNEAITAVEENKTHPDGTIGISRNVGMANALTIIDNMAEHLSRAQSQVGANSNALSSSLERTTMLEVSTTVLRSSVIDIDLAEASLKLTQLSLNYEAMLSTVGKISRLSLVNYL